MRDLHEADEHAPFTHTLITTGDGSEYVICGYCRHWVGRIVPGCRCIASCHAESESRELQPSETSDTIPVSRSRGSRKQAGYPTGKEPHHGATRTAS